LEIILVRHGETQWNAGEIFRGRADIDLNDNGRKQATLVGEFLSHTKISGIYSSPLKRAFETAGAIARYHSLDARVAPGLVDMNFGQWEGLPLDEVKQKFPGVFATWADRPDQAKIPGGETLADVRQRALKAVDAIFAAGDGTFVLVSHRVVIKTLILAFLRLDDSHFWSILVDPSSVTTFTHDGKRYVLRHHNETSFLSETAAHRGDF